jgi:hypothetical protein
MHLNTELEMGEEMGRRHVFSSKVVCFTTKLFEVSRNIKNIVINIDTYRNEFMKLQCINFAYTICRVHSIYIDFERLPSSGKPFQLMIKYELIYLHIQLNLFRTPISFLYTIF